MGGLSGVLVDCVHSGMPHFSMGHGISCDCGVTMLPYHVNRLVTTNGKQIPTNTSAKLNWSTNKLIFVTTFLPHRNK